MKEAESNTVFFINLHIKSEEAVIKTIGLNELDTPIRMPLAEEVMKNLLTYENSTIKCNDELHLEILNIFKRVVPDQDTKNIITVPIISRKHPRN